MGSFCMVRSATIRAALSAPVDTYGYRARAEREGHPYQPFNAESNDCGACPAHPETLVWNEADQLWVCAECDPGINEAARLADEEMEALCGEEREPDCNCFQTDVDMFDAILCDLHNDSSEWNLRRRAEERIIPQCQPYIQKGACY